MRQAALSCTPGCASQVPTLAQHHLLCDHTHRPLADVCQHAFPPTHPCLSSPANAVVPQLLTDIAAKTHLWITVAPIQGGSCLRQAVTQSGRCAGQNPRAPCTHTLPCPRHTRCLEALFAPCPARLRYTSSLSPTALFRCGDGAKAVAARRSSTGLR